MYSVMQEIWSQSRKNCFIVEPQVRVLTKEPKGREVSDDDSFAFNATFAAALYRLKVNAIQLRETAEENTKTNEQVLQDRQYQVRYKSSTCHRTIVFPHCDPSSFLEFMERRPHDGIGSALIFARRANLPLG